VLLKQTYTLSAPHRTRTCNSTKPEAHSREVRHEIVVGCLRAPKSLSVITGDFGGASEPCTISRALSHNPRILGQPDLGHTDPTAPILTWVDTLILDHRRPAKQLRAASNPADIRPEDR
jgi:hypothetical protein